MKTTTKTTPTATITFYHPSSPSPTPPPSTQPEPTTPPIQLDPPPPSPRTLILTSPSLTPFQRRTLLLLLQIPPGHVTTYAALASALDSSPRAVGNALRRNPFAPAVPCHRVVAHDLRLGGFKGKVGWRDGEDGETLKEKRALLEGEAVKFGEDGRVKGGVWGGFV